RSTSRKHHIGAGLSQRARDRQADPSATAGDKGYLSGQQVSSEDPSHVRSRRLARVVDAGCGLLTHPSSSGTITIHCRSGGCSATSCTAFSACSNGSTWLTASERSSSPERAIAVTVCSSASVET